MSAGRRPPGRPGHGRGRAWAGKAAGKFWQRFPGTGSSRPPPPAVKRAAAAEGRGRGEAPQKVARRRRLWRHCRRARLARRAQSRGADGAGGARPRAPAGGAAARVGPRAAPVPPRSAPPTALLPRPLRAMLAAACLARGSWGLLRGAARRPLGGRPGSAAAGGGVSCLPACAGPPRLLRAPAAAWRLLSGGAAPPEPPRQRGAAGPYAELVGEGQRGREGANRWHSPSSSVRLLLGAPFGCFAVGVNV